LRGHLAHLQALQPRVKGAESLAQDLPLHNDGLFSLLTVFQLVIDIAGELNSRQGRRYYHYTTPIQQMTADPRFRPDLVGSLERLPGFCNVSRLLVPSTR
jgi:hypothetical protein